MEESKVVQEALPLFLEGESRSAVLIIHGYRGYAGEFYELGERLNNKGYNVSIPRLPGHGTDKKDFLRTGWRDWLNHIENEYMNLESRFDSVQIVGLSMGGVISLILGARFKPEKIILLAPAMAVRFKLFYLSPIIRCFIRQLPGQWEPQPDDSNGVLKLGREYWSYNFPGQLANLYRLMKLAKKGLGRVKSPIYLILSKSDEQVPLKAGDIIKKGVVNTIIEEVILDYSHHVLVTGVEKERVYSTVLEWIEK